MAPSRMKVALIGAGSFSFCPPTVVDILLDETICSVDLEITLMDIAEDAVLRSAKFARDVAEKLGRHVHITTTTKLEEAVIGADFVVTAIEIRRNYFWSQDFHVPRKYGFRQIYGENGGPGGMFHTLRNMGPMLEIARAMERHCPDAWLINYTNPEAKLVEAISKLTNIKVVGLCHGAMMGVDQLSRFLEIPQDDIDVLACGLNHFGWFEKITHKKTGEDLYPKLRERERQANWLADWDELGLSRVLFRMFGLYPYPGANHIGEYIAWSDDFLASSSLQYFYDPVSDSPWSKGPVPEFIYSFSHHPTDVPLFSNRSLAPGYGVGDTGEPSSAGQGDESQREQGGSASDERDARFDANRVELRPSGEVGVPIIKAIAFDVHTPLAAVNMQNHGTIPGIQDDMVTEFTAYADGDGIHPIQMGPLPAAITEMIRVQGTIHQLVIEAYVEQSRNKLLQAVMLDPTVSSYSKAVAMINELTELQKDILPPLRW